MATRFAVASTSWNTPSTWDNGAVPLAGDTVYPNGFTVPIDTDISVASLNNNVSNVAIPNIATPAMTSNTQPNGTVFANVGALNPWYAFSQDGSTTNYFSGLINGGTLGYTFTTPKTIKRYIIKQSSAGLSYNPKTWEFQGSNDGFATPGVPLDIVASYTTNASYISPLLANTNAYTSYRIVVTAVNTAGSYLYIGELEMTESTTATPVYGTVTGGSFTVPSSLVGIRNITFSGAGLMGNQAATTILSLDNNLTNTVNLNKTSGAYIINPLYNVTDGANTVAILINNNGIVNFNSDIYGTTTNGVGNSNGIIRVVSNPTITVNGNLYPVAGRSTVATPLINFLTTTTNATITVNGSIFGGNLWSNTYAIYSQAVNTINVNGNIISNAGSCITSINTVYLTIVGSVSYTNASSITPITLTLASTVNMTGSVTAPPNAACIICGSGVVNILTGIVTAGTNAVGISAPSSSLVTIGNSPLINTNGYMAVAAPKIRLYSPANVQWVFQDNIASNKVLYSAGGSIGLPLTTNVRNNIQYGASNELTGTMVVPTNPNVRMGVQVDVQPNVGTADLTAQDIFTAIATSPDPVAERLRNVSTVATTGDQLASF
jgi:hypothetical protein